MDFFGCCPAAFGGNEKKEYAKMIKRMLLVIALIAIALSLASCQTCAGLGRDITWSAEATADLLEGQ
jgi:predicted small secreted protein